MRVVSSSDFAFREIVSRTCAVTHSEVESTPCHSEQGRALRKCSVNIFSDEPARSVSEESNSLIQNNKENVSKTTAFLSSLPLPACRCAGIYVTAGRSPLSVRGAHIHRGLGLPAGWYSFSTKK